MPAATVNLAWDPSPDQTVTGYHLYYGVGSRSYTNKVTVPNVSTGSVTGLQPGATYYFAATAFNASNIESDFSNEVSFSIPALPVVTPCLLTFANLVQAYDGQPKQPDVLTSPAGVPVNITYNGSATPPTAVGSYEVVATTAATGYSGSATNTFVITKGIASVTLSNLNQTYNRQARVVTVTTVPAGLPVTVTYNGTTTAPILPGTYKIVCQVTNLNYSGGATGTLVVAKAKVEVNLTNLVQTYNGTARTVLATTTPAGYKVLFTYNGKSAAPTNAGTYTVVGTLSSQTSYGSSTGTLIVNPAAATVILTNLVQAADGNPKAVAATSVPAGLPITVTYNGSTEPPTLAGNYTVVATVNATNYSGSATGTLQITAGTSTPAAPAAPSNLKFVELTWFDSDSDMVVYQSRDMVNWEVLTIVPAGSNSLVLEMAEGSVLFQVAPLGSSEPSPVRISTLP